MPRKWISLAALLSFPADFVGCSSHADASGVDIDEPAEQSGSKPLDVAGSVLDADGRPLGGRSIRIVDARGARRNATSDDDGRFHAAAVAPPYDIAISADVVLGLSERAPRVVVGTTSAAMGAVEHVIATVMPPPCNAPPCWISVVTRSACGRGSASTLYEGDAPATLNVAHALARQRALEDEIEIHALTGDASRRSFAYVRGRPGEVLAPAVVRATRFVVVEANAPSLPDDWTVATSLSITIGGAVFDLASGDARMVSSCIPVIEAATVRARAVARLAPFGERPEWQRSVETTSSRHYATGDIDRFVLDVVAGPELLEPTGASEMSSRTGTFEWSAVDSPTWATLAVTDLTTNAVVIRARTRHRRISLMRLAALGLPKLASGPHLVELTIELPDGSVATQRVPFTAAP